MAVHPVEVTVTYKGQPASGAEVVFYGQSAELQSKEAPFLSERADEQGKLRLTSYELHDGAPAGDYKVTVVWRGELETDDPERASLQPDRLAGKYSDPEKTPLAVTVEPGDNVIPLELE